MKKNGRDEAIGIWADNNESTVLKNVIVTNNIVRIISGKSVTTKVVAINRESTTTHNVSNVRLDSNTFECNGKVMRLFTGAEGIYTNNTVTGTVDDTETILFMSHSVGISGNAIFENNIVDLSTKKVRILVADENVNVTLRNNSIRITETTESSFLFDLQANDGLNVLAEHNNISIKCDKNIGTNLLYNDIPNGNITIKDNTFNIYMIYITINNKSGDTKLCFISNKMNKSNFAIETLCGNVSFVSNVMEWFTVTKKLEAIEGAKLKKLTFVGNYNSINVGTNYKDGVKDPSIFNDFVEISNISSNLII